MSTHIFGRLGRLAGGTVLALSLAACSSTHESGSTSSSHHAATPSAGSTVTTQHNTADVTFAQSMIVHHQGAIAMAKLAATNASSQEVKALASAIESAQEPEITQMTSWLTAWGAPTHSSTDAPDMTDMADMTDMDHSMGSGAMGMMTDEQMQQLRTATGTSFDRMFLQAMTVHHQGAIDMATTEQSNGSNPEAIALAASIVAAQSAEVTQMNTLLQQLGS